MNKYYFKMFFGGQKPGGLKNPIGLFFGKKVGNWNLYKGIVLGNMFLGKWGFKSMTFEPPKC